MAAHDFTIKTEGTKRYLIIDYRGSEWGPSVADFPQCMREVIEKLARTNADMVVLAEVYEIIYSEEQTKMLKEIGELGNLFYREGVWNSSRLGHPQCEGEIPGRYSLVVSIAQDLLKTDPLRAYLTLVEALKRENERNASLQGIEKECSDIYLNTLYFMLAAFEKTTLIQKTKEIIKKLGRIPPGRAIYHSLFEAQIKPAFVASRVFFATPEEIELVDQYYVKDATVNIYKHPAKVQYLYYLTPPEYNLPPEKYFLLSKTKDIVSTYSPEGLHFANPEELRNYLLGVYETTIIDLANKHGIKITGKEASEIAGIVCRYTVGYGILELLLSDRKLTDVYIDAPLGTKPVYVVHGEYGSCQTNVVFTEEEAKTLVSRFRALSGRPFDEAHPVLDFDLRDLQTRIAVIGPPLSPDGTAFALRLHKETPWTLQQFIDVKMIDSKVAGLLSYLIDAQASTLVVGSRGAGKTSLLQALMLEILPSLRILTLEDTLELPVEFMKGLGFNIQRLKTQSAIAVSRTSAEVPPEEALRTALRLGDSVLIVGEVRSKEALVLYEAMRVGAVGNVVMGTIHGESAYSVWDRIVNDLGVPNTSFKATDVCVICAPIRFKGSLKRHRRVVEITSVEKHWYSDPEKEDGFLQLIEYNVDKDSFKVLEENCRKSEIFKRIGTRRGLTFEQIWEDINARAEIKQFAVDQKNKYQIPEILEAKYTVPANDAWLLILERQREDLGMVDYRMAIQEWKDWFLENQVKPLIARREALERAKKKV
ncbi:MAG: type II/IV secretion system ATPase subunit [archaeon]